MEESPRIKNCEIPANNMCKAKPGCIQMHKYKDLMVNFKKYFLKTVSISLLSNREKPIGIIDQVTRFEIGTVALKKTFIFLKGHPIFISIFLCFDKTCSLL